MAHWLRLHGQRIILCLLVLSLIVNSVLLTDMLTNSTTKYPFLSRRLFAENQNNIVINFTKLRTQLRDYAATMPVRAGFYFEYLPTGNSIGINEKEVFFTASLIKLPVVMRAYYLVSESKLRESQSVTLKPEHIDKGFGDMWQRGAGATVPLETLIDAVLQQSDNTAFRALSDLVDDFNTEANDPRSLLDVYNSLDITNDDAGGNAGITPKNFSSILRSLYLSAYLSYEYSNKILEHLAASTFNDWLPEPLPDDIKVAHKFGLYNAEPRQYAVHSDCGIVYHPKRPYMLCVMVNTHDEGTAKKIIRDVSRLAYDYVRTVQR